MFIYLIQSNYFFPCTSFTSKSTCSTNLQFLFFSPQVYHLISSNSSEGGGMEIVCPKQRKVGDMQVSSLYVRNHLFHIFWPSPKIFKCKNSSFFKYFPQVWAYCLVWKCLWENHLFLSRNIVQRGTCYKSKLDSRVLQNYFLLHHIAFQWKHKKILWFAGVIFLVVSY